MEANKSSRKIRTGATTFRSMSISTATTALAWVHATRPVGPGSSPGPCTCSRPPLRIRFSSLASLPHARRSNTQERMTSAPLRLKTAHAKTSMHESPYPSLYQVNTRVWMTELARDLHRPATLDDVPDSELGRITGMGFDWVWFLSVWQTGKAGQRISRTNPEWRREFQETLPDLREEDIPGS